MNVVCASDNLVGVLANEPLQSLRHLIATQVAEDKRFEKTRMSRCLELKPVNTTAGTNSELI
jgi:hypothetical protein